MNLSESQEKEIFPQLMCPVCGCHPMPSKIGPFTRSQKIDGESGTLGDYIRWLCVGPPRTGSSVAFQILNFFDQGAVVKTHKILISDCPCLIHYEGVLCTIRNPYDSFASWSMYNDIEPEDYAIDLDDSKSFHVVFDKAYSSIIGLINYVEYLLPLYRSIHFFRSIHFHGDGDISTLRNTNVVFIKYEDCQKNPILRTQLISKLMNIQPPEEEMRNITEECGINRNLKKIQDRKSKIADGTPLGSIKDVNGEISCGKMEIGSNLGKSSGSRLKQSVRDEIYARYEIIFKIFEYEKDLVGDVD